MKNRSPRGWVALLIAAVLSGVAGCAAAPEPAPASPPREGVAAQACAERLHRLCEELLLYNAAYRLLPRDLTELATTTSSAACPASREPYLYHAAGWPVGRTGEHVIVADARPIHMGHRLGILIQPSEPGQPLVLKVASLPADFDPR